MTSSTSDGNYKAGDVIPININLSEAVTVTGTPKIGLQTGAGQITNEVSSDDVLIEQITISATSFQNIQSSTLENGVNYYLKVTGVYGFGGWSGTSCVDGAFAHCGLPDAPTPVRVWTWNGSTDQTPTPNEYNSNHEYYFCRSVNDFFS